MPITREVKEKRLVAIKEIFQSPFFVLTHYSGISAVNMDKLRSSLTKSGASFCVLKNTLAQRALGEDQEQKERQAFLAPFFKGSAVAVSWSHDENFIHIPKILEKSRKDDCPTLEMVAGCMGKKIFNAEEMKSLAKLPSLEILRAQFIGLLKAPMTRFYRTLSAHFVLLRVLAAKIDKG